MGTRFLAQRLDCLSCLCLQARSENGFVPVLIIFGHRRGFGTVRPARMEFLVGSGSNGAHTFRISRLIAKSANQLWLLKASKRLSASVYSSFIILDQGEF